MLAGAIVSFMDYAAAISDSAQPPAGKADYRNSFPAHSFGQAGFLFRFLLFLYLTRIKTSICLSQLPAHSHLPISGFRMVGL